MFVLLSGSIKLRFRNIKNKSHEMLEITEPSVIKIPPFTTHSIEALSDISILECNSIADIQNDRIREEVILEVCEED